MEILSIVIWLVSRIVVNLVWLNSSFLFVNVNCVIYVLCFVLCIIVVMSFSIRLVDGIKLWCCGVGLGK